ncbi:MAG: hypothetical protein PHD49_02400 [Candidatus Shapirobacteria bacterium]|nr:hypothetical protein [Candidatus Shapirobacteria bacterium]
MENKELKNLSNENNYICRLSEQTVADFQGLYLRKTGVFLSNEEADMKAIELLTFIKSIYKPIKNE